jgi:hypothetical protein
MSKFGIICWVLIVLCASQIGGAFLMPPMGAALEFLSHAQTILKERGVNVSVAFLEYSKSSSHSTWQLPFL